MGTGSRDEFPPATRQLLAKRVRYACSRPECKRATIGPHTDPAKSLSIGRACHINSAAPGGPRFDPAQSEEQRRAPANGIWLCAACSDIVDKDESAYPADLLRAWKKSAEDTAGNELLRPVPAVSSGQRDVVEAQRLLDSALDALAGGEGLLRITWINISPRALEVARRAIDSARTLAPTLPKLRIVWAVYCAAAGFPDRALSALEGVSTEYQLQADLLRARFAFDDGRVSESIAILRELSTRPAPPAAVYFNLAKALDETDRDEAERCLQKAIAIDPDYAEALDALAFIAYQRRDIARATQLSAQAYTLAPTNPETARHYALCLLEQNRCTTAIEISTRAMDANPGHSGLLGILGRAHGQLGKLAEAEECLRQALDLDEADELAHHNLGMVFLYGERWDEAVAEFERAKHLGYPEPQDIRAQVDEGKRRAAAVTRNRS